MRLSHLTAVAVMIALVGAMFVSLAPARAATGDVSANAGYCTQVIREAAPNADPPVTRSVKHYVTMTTSALAFVDPSPSARGTNEVTVEVPDDGGEMVEDELKGGRDADSDPDHIRIECNSAFAGQAVNVAPDGSDSAIVTLAAPTLSISVGDSDSVVMAGGADLPITVSFKNVIRFGHVLTTHRDDVPNNEVAVTSTAYGTTSATDNTAVVTSQTVIEGQGDSTTAEGAGIQLMWIRVSGELDDATVPMGSWAATTNSLKTTLPIPAGTSPGEYTISALAIYDPYSDNTAHTEDSRGGQDDDNDASTPDNMDFSRLTASTTITVGDAGTNAASAELTLGNAVEDDPKTVKVETIPENDSEPAGGGDIWLKLVTKNSNGEAANDGGLSTISIIAPGATVGIYEANARKTAPSTNQVSSGTDSARTTMTGDAEAVVFVKIAKADRKPGSIDVYAQVVGTDGAPRSNTTTLNFTGASSSLTLGDANAVAPSGKTEFTIDAQDAAGNTGSVGQLTFKVTGPDGKGVNQGTGSKFRVTKDTAGSSTPDKEADNNPLQAVGLVETVEATTPGVYTVTVSLAGVADSDATTEVTVSGAAASIAVDADNTEVALNDIVTVTATVKDKNDAQVADGTEVTWGTFGQLTLTRVSAETSKTKDGVATAQFGVSKGTGGARITAISGVASGSVPITGPAGSDAMPEEEASVSCLSNLSGFSTWSCGVDSSASEIFDLLIGRGKTALHLWNGNAWVRYSVVDGTMVPGSSDFMVTESDILYISN